MSDNSVNDADADNAATHMGALTFNKTYSNRINKFLTEIKTTKKWFFFKF